MTDVDGRSCAGTKVDDHGVVHLVFFDLVGILTKRCDLSQAYTASYQIGLDRPVTCIWCLFGRTGGLR